MTHTDTQTLIQSAVTDADAANEPGLLIHWDDVTGGYAWRTRRTKAVDGVDGNETGPIGLDGTDYGDDDRETVATALRHAGYNVA